jgi:hypothetical protein
MVIYVYATVIATVENSPLPPGSANGGGGATPPRLLAHVHHNTDRAFYRLRLRAMSRGEMGVGPTRTSCGYGRRAALGVRIKILTMRQRSRRCRTWRGARHRRREFFFSFSGYSSMRSIIPPVDREVSNRLQETCDSVSRRLDAFICQCVCSVVQVI